METYEKIQMLQKRKGWTVSELADKAGIAATTIYSMYDSGTTPKEQTLQKICMAFGITADQLRYDFEEPVHLTDEQKELLSDYVLLDDEQKAAVRHIIKVMK